MTCSNTSARVSVFLCFPVALGVRSSYVIMASPLISFVFVHHFHCSAELLTVVMNGVTPQPNHPATVSHLANWSRRCR